MPDRSPWVGCDQLTLLELQRAGKLREYYDGLVVAEDSLERGLQMGTLVVDRRLGTAPVLPGEEEPLALWHAATASRSTHR